MGQGETENILTGTTKVQNYHNAQATTPPRIEQWVMEMQDVEYELVY